MKIRPPLYFAAFFLLLGAGALYAFQQPPTVTVAPAQPGTVYLNSASTVTISAQISDPRILARSVNLLQLDPISGSQRIVGSLNGSGQTFTISLQPDTAAPKLLTYQVSAAFLGLIKRSLSDPITVAVVPQGVILPPDPGSAGLQTLAGIDADGDGVRDDVQRLIATFGLPTSTEKAASQEAVVIQKAILVGTTTPDSARSIILDEIIVDRCLRYSGYQNIANAVQAAMLNTTDRFNAYFRTDEQTGGLTTDGLPDGTAACSALP